MQEVVVTPRRVLAASAILVIVAVVQLSCTRVTQETSEVGSTAPNFKLRNLNGKEVSLDQFRGKIVLLDFWATWCVPCRMAMPMMEALQKEFPKSVKLLAINVEEPASVVRDYVREQDIDTEVLLDEDGAVGSAYGLAGIPLQVLIDKEGNLRRVQTGVGSDTVARFRADIQKLQ